MSKTQKITNVFVGIIMFIVALIMLTVPDVGYKISAAILGGAITLVGIKDIVYYFLMAKHMVGGRKILFNGIIIFDFGVLTLLLIEQPQTMMMFYIIVLFLISGIINILRFVEIKRMDGHGYVKELVKGIINILISVLCLVFISSNDLAVLIFGIGLMFMAFDKISNAFSKSQIIYIK